MKDKRLDFFLNFLPCLVIDWNFEIISKFDSYFLFTVILKFFCCFSEILGLALSRKTGCVTHVEIKSIPNISVHLGIAIILANIAVQLVTKMNSMFYLPILSTDGTLKSKYFVV